MQLICKKYEWSRPVEMNEANFFSTASKTLIDTLDLFDYLEEGTLSPFESQHEGINQVSQDLEIKMSNVSFRCKNELYNHTDLQDFFEVYDSNPFIKFQLQFYDDNNIERWRGIIYKDGVEFAERRNDMLDIMAVNELKEFYDYFGDKDLLAPSFSVTSQTLFGTGLNGLKFYTLHGLFGANFPTVLFGNIPNDYYLAERGYTYAPLSVFEEMEDLVHIKNGLYNFLLDDVKRLEYFTSLVMSKGWIWYFQLGKLSIKDRGGRESYTTTNIDYNSDFIQHGITSDLNEDLVDTVIIDNGTYFDNLGNEITTLNGLSFHNAGNNELTFNMSGEIGIVISKFNYSNASRPIKGLRQYAGSFGAQYYENLYNGVDHTRFIPSYNMIGNPENYYVYERLHISAHGTASNIFDITANYYYYPIKRVLNIRPVINSTDNSSGIDKYNARADTGIYYGNGNYINVDTITDSQWLYKANPAAGLIKYNSETGKYISYEVDVQREGFYDNFKKFLRGANPVMMNIRVKGLYWDLLTNVTISNYPFADLSTKSFSIQRLNTDYLNNWTDMTLQMNEATATGLVYDEGNSLSDYDYILDSGYSNSVYELELEGGTIS